MGYAVLIRNNETGETRRCEQTETEWGEGSEFWWTEGNMACDCNRHLEFTGVVGERDDDGAECGDKKYTAIKAILPDGREIKLDN